MRQARLPRFQPVVLALLAAAGLVACGGDDPEPANRMPTVELTAGPMDGDSTAWNASFHWVGVDPDGFVDHYEYALDVPPGRMDEIDLPSAPGIDWVSTTALEGTFPFGTPEADSAYGTDGMPGPPTRWTGNHTFAIRAVDDDGARSAAEFIEFTALNYAPRTTIEGIEGKEVVFWFHAPSCPPLLRWQAEDPDIDSGLPSDIAGHDIKVKQMPYTWVPVARSVDELLAALADIPWQSLPADSTELLLTTPAGYPYIVAVRTRDGRGATESVFVRGRNLFVAEASAIVGTPSLVVRERLLGSAFFPGPVAEMSVAAGTSLRFEMTGDGSDFGAIVEEYNYGIDVDPDSDGTGPGWRGWSTERVTEPIVFDEPNLHTLVFRTRAGTATCPAIWNTTGIVIVRSIQFPLDRECLYVDDFRRPSTDVEQDARNRAMLAAAGVPVDDPGQFTQYDAWGSSDLNTEPTLLTLESLAAFRLVYWDCLGSGFTRNPLLAYANACPTGRVLQAYVAGGGSVWVTGQSVMAAFDAAPGTTCNSNMSYEFGSAGEGLNFILGDFLNDFMRISGGGFLSPRSNLDRNGLQSAAPTAKGAAVGLPPLLPDAAFFPAGTIGFTDAMFTPSFEATGGLDSLYVHRAGPTSGMNNKPDAFRYHDPSPVPAQGPVAIFLFPLPFLVPGSVAEGTGTHQAARVMVDWFRSEQQRYFRTNSPGSIR
jgi:hypothetical protein